MSGGSFAVAIELDSGGTHPAAWRGAQHPPSELLSPRRLASVAANAERHGFTAITLDDSPLPPGPDTNGPVRLDAVQRAAYLAPLTSAIGLVPVVDVVYPEPVHVATRLASLDYASAGRAGWIVTASASEATARAFAREPVTDAAALHREAEDVIEVARRLWDSWEDDAVIRDIATGRYLDRDKLHNVDFSGATFSVKGPSFVPRPPQGQLIVFGADVGADVALVAVADEPEVASAAARARSAGALRVFAEVEVAIDSRGLAAERRIAELDAFVPWRPSSRLRYVGDAEGFVELLSRLSQLIDGVRILPAVIDVDLEELGRCVLPALRREIGFSSPTAGAMLRESLGLPRPTNRYTPNPV